MDVNRFPELIRAIYRAVDELEAMFPGRHFTPDGHMVGSIGEALAAYYYGIELFPASFKGHDGKLGDRLIQIKATQAKSIAISSEPKYLLVLRIAQDGSFVEVYNGPGAQVWASVSSKPRPKNGQYQVRLSTLQRFMPSVPASERVARVRG
jgi:hypothetical protein